MLRHGVVGQCLPEHGEAGFTLPFLPQTSVLVIQFSEEFHSVLLFYFYILLFLWDVGQVCMCHVWRSLVLPFQPVSLGDWIRVFKLGSRCFTHWAISWAFLLYFTFLFYWFIHLFYIYGCLLVSVSVPGAWGGSKRAPDPLELKIQSRCWG